VVLPSGHPWGYRADAAFGPAGDWLGGPLAAAPLAALVLRYLGAFGPAAARDVQAWSGLTGMGPVLEELRPGLLVFRDERGRELFDLPDAPRPPEDTPAPARFVAEFDNLILAHADRTRVIADEHRPLVFGRNAVIMGTVLVDGFVAGAWRASRSGKTAALGVYPFAPLPGAARAELAEEGERLLRFLEPDAARLDLRFEPPV
jgi:hypothetical protein